MAILLTLLFQLASCFETAKQPSKCGLAFETLPKISKFSHDSKSIDASSKTVEKTDTKFQFTYYKLYVNK